LSVVVAVLDITVAAVVPVAVFTIKQVFQFLGFCPSLLEQVEQLELQMAVD
jgi:hypothetical protein